MNKKIFIFSFLAGLLLFSSCKDEDLNPIVTFDILGKGAYVRLVSETAREFDLQNLNGAQYEYTVEFVDLEKGALVQTYEINVTYVDNNPDNGDKSGGPSLLRSISSSEFTTNEKGFKQVTVTITLAELATLFGTAPEDIKANDQFIFDGVLTLNDGSKFSFDNSTAAVRGSAFQSHFRFTIKATCPLNDDQFTGTYLVTYEVEPSGAFGPAFGAEPGTVEVTTVSGSSTKRAFELVYLKDLGIGNGPSTITVDFVCDFVVLAGDVDGQLSCGGDAITIGPGDPVPVDLNDDSSFVVNMVEFKNDGGCGVPTAPFALRLTKQ